MAQVIIDYDEYQELLKLKSQKISKLPGASSQILDDTLNKSEIHLFIKKSELIRWLKGNDLIPKGVDEVQITNR